MSYNNSPEKNASYIDTTIVNANYPDKNYQQNLDANNANIKSLVDYQVSINADLDSYAKTGVRSVAGSSPNLQFPTSSGGTVKKPDLDIDASYNDIVYLRGQLDEKLGELYLTDNSILADDKLMYDTTIYTGVLWTVLATVTVYYLFVDL